MTLHMVLDQDLILKEPKLNYTKNNNRSYENMRNA
jgi:hypothetical protein